MQAVHAASHRDALAATLARAKEARPGLVFDERAFAARLAASGWLGEGAADMSGLWAGDLALACACLEGNARAIEILEREVIATIPTMLGRKCRNRVTADEVQQWTRERMLVGHDANPPKLASYTGRGSLAAWTRVVATRLLLTLTARDGAQPQSDDAIAETSLDDDLELRFHKERQRPDVKRAFQDAFAALTASDRTLLRLSLLDGLTIEEIGRVIQVHRTTVIRRLQTVREALVADLRRRLTERLRCSRGEIDELIVLVSSQLDLSLWRVLA